MKRLRIVWQLVLLSLPALLQAQAPVLEFQSLATGLSSPLDIVSAYDGTNRLFIVERGNAANSSANIRIYTNGQLLATPFLTVTGISCCSERGLLSMVFHPDYENNRTFWVYYTAPDGALTIARYRTPLATPDVADPASRQVVLSIPHSQATNHNGGKMWFGPDGYLYVGTGDGGGSNDQFQQAQNPNTLLGKMLRIAPSVDFSASGSLYTIPPDNPYAAANDGVANEIFAMGLRNPWRWSFDRQTGAQWIADVGQGFREEANYKAAGQQAGANYGWPCFEATAPFQNNCTLYGGTAHTIPVLEYVHTSTGGYSITGGFVYRGNAFAALRGWYVCADYVLPNAFLVQADNGLFTSVRQGTGIPANISSFGEDEQGELYAVSLTAGTLYRIIVPGALPLRLLQFSGAVQHDVHVLRWQYADAVAGDTITLQRQWGQGPFENVYSTVATPGSASLQVHRLAHKQKEARYRLRIAHSTGAVQWSQQLWLAAGQQPKPQVRTSAGGWVMVQAGEAGTLRLVNALGQTMGQPRTVNAGESLQWQLPQCRGQALWLVSQPGQGAKTHVQKIWLPQ